MLSKWWYTFNNSNSSTYRFLRTLFQAVVAAAIVAAFQVTTAAIPELVGSMKLSPELTVLVTGFLMSIVATLQSQYGKQLPTPGGE